MKLPVLVWFLIAQQRITFLIDCHRCIWRANFLKSNGSRSHCHTPCSVVEKEGDDKRTFPVQRNQNIIQYSGALWNLSMNGAKALTFPKTKILRPRPLFRLRDARINYWKILDSLVLYWNLSIWATEERTIFLRWRPNGQASNIEIHGRGAETNYERSQ